MCNLDSIHIVKRHVIVFGGGFCPHFGEFEQKWVDCFWFRHASFLHNSSHGCICMTPATVTLNIFGAKAANFPAFWNYVSFSNKN